MLKLTWPSVAALPRGLAAERQSFGRLRGAVLDHGERRARRVAWVVRLSESCDWVRHSYPRVWDALEREIDEARASGNVRPVPVGLL
jgi:hypothetical protein